MQQAGVVVALVEILEDTGKDFGFFVRKMNPLALALEELSLASRRKEGRQAENILVGCKKSILSTNRQGDDRRGQSPACDQCQSSMAHTTVNTADLPAIGRRTLLHRPLQLRQPHRIPTRLLRLDSLLHAIMTGRSLEHGCDGLDNRRSYLIGMVGLK